MGRQTWVVAAAALAVGLFALVGCHRSPDMQESVPAPEPEPEPYEAPAGSYTVECSRLIAGGEREVQLTGEGVVSWVQTWREDPQDGDGMADSIDSYTFVGEAPGAVDVLILNVLPWMEDDIMVEEMFRLVVDDELVVQREEVPLVESFELREKGDMAAYQVLSAEPGDAGLLLMRAYTEEFDGPWHDERELSVRPDSLTALFLKYDVRAWDGFYDADYEVLDGKSFTFRATLSDGTTISASGENAFPPGYGAFRNEAYTLLGM